MTRFDADPQPTGTYVGGVVTPTNEVVAFSPALQHDLVGAGWTTWSNGYSGDVYWGSANVTITLPGGTPAFYFYAEPDPYDVFTISATAQDGTSSGAISVNGYHGAQYFGFYSKGTSRIASISVTGSVDFAIGEFGIGKGKYVALGDSYSSGEGNPPFQAGTDGPADFCHRSDAAYPELIGADRKEKPDFWACSGATTANVTSTSFNNEPPQLSRPDVDKATLVTMTIGGNDAHFSDVLSTCIRQKLVADAYNSLVVGRVGMWLGLGRDPSCVHSAGFWASVMSGVASAASSAESTYAAVKAKASDGATVVVGDYPRLFPADQRDQGCMGLSTFLTYDDMAYMNGAANQLDGGLAASAAAAGVTFADVRPYFAGHEVCGPSGPWLNGISLASGTGKACAWSFKGHCIIPGGLPVVGSFHPNTGGHAGGYYPAFKAAIDAASQSAALASLAVTPRTTATDPPADTFGDLDVLPATPSGPACEGSYQPGQELQVAAGGFAPGAPVEVYVTSPGLGDTAEELAATLTADAAGAVSGTVRIPLAATGFTPQGADAGLVFLDAIGPDPAGSHRVAGQMAGLVPQGTDCGSVRSLPFDGFDQPVANLPAIGTEQPGRTIPVKFTIAGVESSLAGVLAPGYPQSAPVSCTDPAMLTTGEPTSSVASGSTGDAYRYEWKTDEGWRGCRELIVGLVDGTYHRAVVDFG